MNFVNNLLSRIFGSASESEFTPVKTPIKRDSNFQKSFEEWIISSELTEITTTLLREWQFYCSDLSSSFPIHFHKGQGSEGFFFTPGQIIREEHFPFILEWISDRCREFGYKRQNAFREAFLRSGKPYFRQVIYLKPVIKYHEADVYNQKWGNILLEYETNERGLAHLKVMITRYNDRKYSQQGDMSDFMANIFGIT